jgi:hypothetical protein
MGIFININVDLGVGLSINFLQLLCLLFFRVALNVSFVTMIGVSNYSERQ